MKLHGQGRAALAGDPRTAEMLGWRERRRSRPDPQILLKPRTGDPTLEPWIVPPWFAPAAGIGALCGSRPRPARCWTYLPGPPGLAKYLERLARPPATRIRLGLFGLGRIGGIASVVLAAMPAANSGIAEILVDDVDTANRERWLLELGAFTSWRGREGAPRLRPTSLGEVFHQCDVFVFAAATGVPPLGSPGDVRMVQFAPNRAILRACLEQARAADYSGLFLVVSDPVDWLAQSAFRDSNTAGETFTGEGLAPERIAGLGLGVMWGRALDCARREGWDGTVARRGAAYGPHGDGVLVFDDLRAPTSARSEPLTRAAREGNIAVRGLGFLPFVAPGVSSIALTLPLLLAGREALASVFLDGVFFGAPCRQEWGIYPTRHALAPEVAHALRGLHGGLRRQAASLGLFPVEPPRS
ncbi:MAG: hypothetical protein KBD01_16955 [Acidobacteria bacterium]|nr:hypothetical protein [Acidobacteriota bacterium]